MLVLTTMQSRVAHTLCFMYAPHEHAQNPCHRVLSVACPGLSTVAEIKGDVGATRGGRGPRSPSIHRNGFPPSYDPPRCLGKGG
jgi:hypothetical protein